VGGREVVGGREERGSGKEGGKGEPGKEGIGGRGGREANLTFLSLLDRNRPRMLIARTRRPLSHWISIMVNTVSYKMECPTFFPDSVLVATCGCSQSILLTP
jgi:hypothetical protein